MRYMLDTNIVSYYLRRKSPSLDKRVKAALISQEACVSAVIRAELRYGQALLPATDVRHQLIESILPNLPTLSWTLEAADTYGQIFAHLKTLGTPIGELDTQIAAHALAENLILVTHNTKHFERIKSLRMEDWMQAWRIAIFEYS